MKSTTQKTSKEKGDNNNQAVYVLEVVDTYKDKWPGVSLMEWNRKFREQSVKEAIKFFGGRVR